MAPSAQDPQENKPSTSTGSGPTLRDPDDKIQESDQRNSEHVENVTRNMGAGPTLQNQDAELFSDEEPVSRQSSNASVRPAHTKESHKSEQEREHEAHLAHLREIVGLPEEPPILEEHEETEHFTWPSFRVIFREPFAEFFGTFVMVLFGNGSVAQVLLGAGQTTAPGKDGYGGYQNINWGWGLGVMLGIYVAGDSGGFLNPAITIGFCIYRKLPWRRWPIYLVAQFLGGFCAAGVVYANYINAIDNYEGHGVRTVPPSATATASIFCTYPQSFLTKASQFFSEFIASTILMFVIFALKDDSNPGAMGKTGAGALFPLGLFFLIFGLGSCFGWETGYAVNFARDFGPRLMSYILGYGPEVWTAGNYYFWIPMVAPMCGCIFGGFLYDAFIYTGPESPLNKPWWGFKALYKKWGLYRKVKDEKRLEKGKYDV